MTREYKTPEPVFKALSIEIDWEPMPEIGQFHVGEPLRLVDVKQVLHTFEFHDDLLDHENIDAISAVQAESSVFDRKRMLQQERNCLEFQFVSEALFISPFQQAWTERAVTFNRAADHMMRQIREIHANVEPTRAVRKSPFCATPSCPSYSSWEILEFGSSNCGILDQAALDFSILYEPSSSESERSADGCDFRGKKPIA